MGTKDPPLDDEGIQRFIHGFGHHVRSLRKARGLTQKQLGLRSGLCADTIRRLERGTFSPGLDTLLKVSAGLRLPVATLFSSLTAGEERDTNVEELVTLLKQRRDVPITALVALIDAWVVGER